MSVTAPNIGIKHSWGQGFNGWHTDNDANLRALDALVQATVLALQNAPPTTPADGDAYLVGTSPTGAWSGHANAFARYNAAATAWEFWTPKTGWTISVAGSLVQWNGSQWDGPQMVSGAGINGAAGVARTLWLRTNGTLRWGVRVNATAEAGNSAGSDFELNARNDDGSEIDSPIVIFRASGGLIRIGGSNRTTAFTGEVTSNSSFSAASFTGVRIGLIADKNSSFTLDHSIGADIININASLTVTLGDGNGTGNSGFYARLVNKTSSPITISTLGGSVLIHEGAVYANTTVQLPALSTADLAWTGSSWSW